LVDRTAPVGDEVGAPQPIGVVEVLALLERAVGVDQLGDQPRAVGVDVLGADLAVAHGEVRVHIGRLALRPALGHALAGVVVGVGQRFAVLEDRLDAVFLIPDDVAARAVLVVGPAGL